MNKKRPYAGVITIIYAAAVITTVLAFVLFGFSESQQRFIVSLLAILVAESVVYGYTIYWLRRAGSTGGTSPVLISGAVIAAIYAAAVFMAAIILDWLLEVPSFWYAAAQLLILAAGAVSLALIGLYGWNAGTQERQTEQSSRSLRLHQKELGEMKRAAESWTNSGAEQLAQQIQTIEEKFKYSDPVSKPSLFATEDMLSQQISLLRDQVELLLASEEPQDGWEAEINEMAESIDATLQRRNRELAALK